MQPATPPVEPPRLIATRTPEAPSIDGKLDDAAWKVAAEATTFTQKFPNEGVAPSDRTTMRVLYDEDACIGSRACMNACPYGALHFYEGKKGESLGDGTRTRATVPDHGAARRYTPGTIQKCTFCVHRIDYGTEHGLVPGIDPAATPACVVTCPAECRIFGDLEDPESPVNQYLEERGPAKVLRPDAKTGAHVFYVG